MKKVAKIEYIEPFDIYDITVENDHCFELENGVIAHNSLFPKDIVGGGCVVAGTKIQTEFGLKNIEDIQVGDLVMTFDGLKPVLNTWDEKTLINPEPECYEIEFEDGYKVICSDEHPFRVNGQWVKAKDLQLTDNVDTL
jgi:intein/homing endonuclease